MARVAFEDEIAELDKVADDAYKGLSTFGKRCVSDMNLVQVIAPKVEHESVLRGLLSVSA